MLLSGNRTPLDRKHTHLETQCHWDMNLKMFAKDVQKCFNAIPLLRIPKRTTLKIIVLGLF